MLSWSDRDWSVPPGELLLEVLNGRQETGQQLAAATGLPASYIADLLVDAAPMHGTAAAHLAEHTGISDAFWLGAQTMYVMHGLTTTGTLRILVTGSRNWTRREPVEQALQQVIGRRRDVLVRHGAAFGVDGIAHDYAIANGYGYDPCPAPRYPSAKARNQHMVDQGADICLAFALSWDSGTGQCARMARRAGIPVVDYGVDTRQDAPAKVLARA
jgi:plasmid maintenance system antidote protein VapI